MTDNDNGYVKNEVVECPRCGNKAIYSTLVGMPSALDLQQRGEQLPCVKCLGPKFIEPQDYEVELEEDV